MTRTYPALILLALTGVAAAAPGGFFGGVILDERPAGREPGVRVTSVVKGSPADAGGLRAGDRVVRCGGQPADYGALSAALARGYPGDALKLEVLRGDKSLELTVTLGTWRAHRVAQKETGLAPEPGQSIYVAGVPFDIGAPVVTWKDPGGFDGYYERCFFDPEQVFPSRPAQGCKTVKRYAHRRNLPGPLAEVVAAKGWTPELAAVQIDQVVVHYDVAWTSHNCFKVLHDMRGLSCQFLLDVDGTLYQTLDVVERARHAGYANDRSIGIEIAHPGPLELTKGLADRYSKKDGETVFDLGPRLGPTVRTKGFLVHPARPEPVSARVQGRTYSMYDFTSEQYATLAKLLAALHRILPRIRLRVPRDASGKVRDAVLAPIEVARFSGILGHYHISSHKQDPGPAFDWERVLKAARKLDGE